jgi:hypothetical protein
MAFRLLRLIPGGANTNTPRGVKTAGIAGGEMRGAWGLFVLVILIPALRVAAWQHGSRSHSICRPTTGPNDWHELIGSMNRMHVAMNSVEPSGNDDADFVKLMLPHHRAAVDMAQAELLYGSDPQMRRLAQEIITDQESEIQLMQLWLGRQRTQSKERQSLDSEKEQ